jgi:protein-tyrosine phosphatase
MKSKTYDERTPRTSVTHPLEIAVIGDSPFRGALGVTFAPGKKDANAQTGAWDRDLSADLDAVAAWNARVVLTLVEPHEFEPLGIPSLGKEVRRRGMDWLHLPVRDVSVPAAGFEQIWPAHSAALRDRLRAGDNVLIHCRGGLGRAGMVAARLLVEEGVEPEAAMAAVRAARPGAIETGAQEDWVRAGIGGEAARATRVTRLQEGRDVGVAPTSDDPALRKSMAMDSGGEDK